MISFTIANKKIGPGHPCFIIAEVAQAHDGSLGTAHAYIDAIAKTGADAVKFQTHIADAESTPHEKFRVDIFPQDTTRYDYWKRMEFSPDQWAGLSQHAQDVGLIFLSTPFSVEAVELLKKLRVAAWKIGSGEVSNVQLLRMVGRTGKPILLSSGMSSWGELDEAVACIREGPSPLALLQCTTSYPCPPEKVGLNVLEEMRTRYDCPVGLSDHSGKIYSALAAAAIGTSIIEVHTVFSRESFGPDVESSVTTTELATLVEGVRFIERCNANPVRKDIESESNAALRFLFGRSLVAARDLDCGHKLEMEDIAVKKPGTGIPARRLNEFVGHILKRPYLKNELLEEKDIE